MRLALAIFIYFVTVYQPAIAAIGVTADEDVRPVSVKCSMKIIVQVVTKVRFTYAPNVKQQTIKKWVTGSINLQTGLT